MLSFVYFEQMTQGLQYMVAIIAILHLIKELFQLKKQVGFLLAPSLLVSALDDRKFVNNLNP